MMMVSGGLAVDNSTRRPFLWTVACGYQPPAHNQHRAAAAITAGQPAGCAAVNTIHVSTTGTTI